MDLSDLPFLDDLAAALAEVDPDAAIVVRTRADALRPPPGPPGPPGAQGDVGPMGPQGAPGMDGAPGAAGAQGPAGPTGANGQTGPAGAAGQAGPQGATGPTGPTGAQGPIGTPGSAGTTMPLAFVDARSFGAVGDFNVSTLTGTDDTVAIQAALDSTKLGQPNAGKTVLLFGRHKTTATLNMAQGQLLAGLPNILSSAFTSQGAANGVAIDFMGGPTDHGIVATGSRVGTANLFVCDRRVAPTAGDGIHYTQVVNDAHITNVDVFWTDGIGNGIYIGSPAAGSVSDCVTVDNCWVNGGLYGLFTERIDNYLIINGLKCDTANGALQKAMIHCVGTNTSVITGTKHENRNANTVTIEIDGSAFPPAFVLVDGAISRVGSGGAVVRVIGGTGQAGSGVQCRGLVRQNPGVLVETTNTAKPKSTSGLRLGFWQIDPVYFGGGSAWIWADPSTSDLDSALLHGRWYFGESAINGAPKVGVRADAGQIGLTVTAPASPTADYFRVIDSTFAVQVAVDKLGKFSANGDAFIGGPGKKLGFLGATPVVRPTVTGARADGTALASLLSAFVALGLVTDSTT